MPEAHRLRLYTDLAHLFPLITPAEEYAQEAKTWTTLLRQYLGDGRQHVLELGVGAGHNLSHLTDEFDATAVDLSEQMIALSKELNPGVEHLVGDMREIRLNRKFDAVLIHDAINHMQSVAELRAVFVTAREHLQPGGILITGPEWDKESFPGVQLTHSTGESGGTSLTFVQHNYDADSDDEMYESVMVYVITENGATRVEQDECSLGLFSESTWIETMTEAGFAVTKHDDPEMQDYAGYNLVGVAL